MDKDQTKRLPRATQRDGVIYTPSGRTGDAALSNTRVVKAKPQGPAQGKSRPPAKKKKKSGIALFMATTIFVAMLAIAFLGALFLQPLIESGFGTGDGGGDVGGDNSNTNIAAPPTTPTPTPPPQGQNIVLGLVRNISVESRRVDIYAIHTSENRSFFADGGSEMRDRFGAAISFPEFSVGDVIELTHPDGSNSVTSMRISPQVVRYNEISDAAVNLDAGTVLIGMRHYQLTPSTIVHYRGTPANIADISQMDVVNVDVLGDRIMYLNIIRSHGFIVIPEDHPIIGGSIEIGNSIFAAIEGDGGSLEIAVPAGDHRVIIRGDNIEIFMDNFIVNRGQSVEIDLDDIELRSGILVLNANTDATLTIDGEIFAFDEPIIKEFGTYTLRLEQYGFYLHEQEITIGAVPLTLNIELEEIFVATARTVNITTNPSGVSIYINDEFRGFSPLSVELEFGIHQVTVSRPGYIGGTIPIEVTETSRDPHIQLQPDARVPWFD